MFVPFKNSSTTERVIATLVTWSLLLGAWVFMNTQNPIIPTPLEVVSAWGVLLQRGLLVRVMQSYSLNVQALFWATMISFGMAYLSVIGAIRPLNQLITKLRFLGFTGISFVFGLYAQQRRLQIWMLVFGVTVFLLTSMISVVAAVPEREIDHARTLRMSPWRTTWEVVVRGTLDQSLDALRQNAAMGWMMLTMVEGLVMSEGGVGVMLIGQNRQLNLAAVFALQASILLVGILQDRFLNWLRLTLCPYSAVKEGK